MPVVQLGPYVPIWHQSGSWSKYRLRDTDKRHVPEERVVLQQEVFGA